mgnify:CR=1 FL=1
MVGQGREKLPFGDHEQVVRPPEDPVCFEHASRCYEGPPADAVRKRAQVSELIKYFAKVAIPPDTMQPGDVVVWAGKHCALAVGKRDLVFQQGAIPQHLDDFVRYRDLIAKPRPLTKADKLEVTKFEGHTEWFHSESIATANDLKTRGRFGGYTVYRIKPEFSKYKTCKQLTKLASQTPPRKDHEPHRSQDFNDKDPHICWCGDWHRYRGRTGETYDGSEKIGNNAGRNDNTKPKAGRK